MSAHQPAPIEVLSQGRAAVYEEPSGPAGVRVRELPRTHPKPGQVAVAIKTASVNHLDLWLAHGAQRIEPPRLIAPDGAGGVPPSGDPAREPRDEGVSYPVAGCWGCGWVPSGQQGGCPR